MKKLLFSLIIFIAVFMFGCNKNKTCTIDVENVDVLVGESYELSLNTNVKNPHFVYEIDNNIIEIKDDVIYAKEIGIANVDVSVKNHEGKASFVVRVCQEGLTIFGLHEQVILEHQQLDLVRFGVDEEEHITWRSSNIDVARVSNGEVIPNARLVKPADPARCYAYISDTRYMPQFPAASKSSKVKRENLFIVRINSADRVLFGDKLLQNDGEMLQAGKDFLRKHGKDALFSLIADRGTSYGAYRHMRELLMRIYADVRAEKAMEQYGKSLSELSMEEVNQIYKQFPLSIKEAEPK